MFETKDKKERTILVNFYRKGFDRNTADEHLRELRSLATTAGAEVIETFYQEVDQIHPATAIGKGKVEEIVEFMIDKEITSVIFDDDLSPVQKKNLEIKFNTKVIDRSQLIIDIFSKHAKTIEAKTQVELAQLKYMLPRLTRMWTHLSKQLGGIGTKGPGETQIETDRRMIKLRIQKLESKLQVIEIQREQQRKGRESFSRFALVGYTNAGKSTLMNCLSQSEVLVEDKLFATLDTTVRQFDLPTGKKALISDTVGFIRKLPPNLIASFRTTLSEVKEADFILHVVDISNPFFREHIYIVEETLNSLEITNKPIILILNKIDNLTDRSELSYYENEFPDSVPVSAERGINISRLLTKMQNKIDESSLIKTLFIPYSDSKNLAKIYQLAEVMDKQDLDDGIEIKVRFRDEFKSYYENIFFEFEKK